MVKIVGVLVRFWSDLEERLILVFDFGTKLNQFTVYDLPKRQLLFQLHCKAIWCYMAKSDLLERAGKFEVQLKSFLESLPPDEDDLREVMGNSASGLDQHFALQAQVHNVCYNILLYVYSILILFHIFLYYIYIYVYIIKGSLEVLTSDYTESCR